MEPAIEVSGLRKSFGAVEVLNGIDLRVERGSVHALLGPNGAGKTTVVTILATLVRPDAGMVTVAGVDLLNDPAGVRRRIALTGQSAAVDDVLTAEENLRMMAGLRGLRGGVARRRTRELLERFDLTDAARRRVKTFSGGMRRRLDLALSLVVAADVVFLDEPTTGLDPRSRRELWDVIRTLRAEGTTVLLTTQYLEEADRLCTRISLMELGRVVAEGSPAELKSRVGGSRVEIVVPGGRDLPAVAGLVSAALAAAPEIDAVGRRVSVPMPGGTESLIRLAHALDEAGLDPAEVSLRRPDLDEVFLHLTDRPELVGAGR